MNFNTYITTGFCMILFALSFTSCKSDANKIEDKTNETQTMKTNTKTPNYKLSLAQWSLHKGIFNGTIDPMNFAVDAKNLGYTGLEYVSQLYINENVNYPYKDKGIDAILKELKRRSDSLGMENLIIMVDGEGDLSFNDEALTNEAIENHKKWIDAAAYLGCHSIRVNLFGEEDRALWVKNSVRSLKALIAYSEPKGVSILVENHGGLSSDGKLLVEVMQKVNSDFCGTLPDFGNFCLKRKDGERWAAACIEEYDMYKGIDELMPYAKGVSAKSYDFNDNGEETKINYAKMIDIVKSHGFSGYIGVEYEGEDPINGINATKALVEKLINKADSNE